jgi:hypothetical protein
MADTTGGENIGGINVSIGADYSPLQSAFSTAEDLAQKAGADIADALVSGASSAGNIGDVLSEQLEQIGPAADDAGSSLEGFAGDATDAGEAAEGSASKLGELAEQMTAVGEALIITEGLKELGEEALGAADSITHASIALTTITGSADTAKETIEGLEQLGMSDGLAMPSLLSAATRMQQILGPATDVTEELKMVADGAAAMGTDIETAAQKFDQIASAGTASARTLTSLGISLQGLADAFNTVEGGAVQTSDSVAAAFKTLDQSERIDVLNQALSTLGGTAEQVANQTFGGQWQQLANGWESVMVQAGQAILPVVSAIVSLTKTEIIPFLQSAIASFNALPEPVKDTAVAVAAVAAALVPIAGIAAAAAIGLNGLAEAAELLGINSATAAPEVVALNEAVESSAVDMPVIEGVAAGAAGVLGGILVVGLTAAALGFTDLQRSIKSAQAAYGDQDAAQVQFSAQLNKEIEDLKTADLTTEDAAKATEYFQQQLDLGTISAGKFADAVKNIATAQSNLKFDELSTLAQDFNGAMKLSVDVAQKASDNITLLNAVLADSQTKLTAAAAAWQAGTGSAQGYISAQNAVKTAQDNLNAALGPTPGSIEAITAASSKLADAGNAVVSAAQQEQDTQTAANASMDLAQKSYTASQIALSSYTSQLHDAATANNGSAQSEAAVTTAEQNVQKAYAASQTELKGLTDTVQNYITYMNGSGASTKAQIDLLQDLADKFGPATSAAIGLTTQIKALQDSLPAFGVQITSFNSGPISGLQSAFDEATKNVAKFQAQMDAGQNSGQQYEKALTAQLKALVDLNVAVAESSTGLQGQSDAYSLAAIAVAAAQAKYDTLNAAFQTNITLAPQVKAAQDALTNAQKALNDQTTTAISLSSQLDQQYPQLTSSVNSATTAFNSQTTAMQSNVKALNDVAAAVTAVEADMKVAFQSVNDGQVQIAAQQGTYYSGGLITGGTNGFQSTSGAYYDTPAAAYSKALAAAQQVTPVAGTSASALAQDVLAQAQAVLQVYEQFYGQGVGVTASDIQTAQTAVATAQAALATATGSSSSASTGTSTSTSPYSSPILASPISVSIPGLTSSTTTAATAATVSGSDTTSGGGTSAVDGGSYPAVTAHQAVGEIWAVTTSGTGGTGGGGVSSSISTSISNTVVGGSSDATALQAATQAIGNVGQQIATNSGNLLPISQSLIQTATATQQLATAVAGLVQRVDTGSGSLGTFATTGGGGTASPSGPVVSTVGGGNPLGQYVPPSSTPISSVPGYNPFGPGSAGGTTSINVTVNAQGAIGLNAQQLNAQITSAVVSNLVPQLQTAGARLTR